MELGNDFGNPHHLMLAEDHIVLRLKTALPPDVKAPEGFTLGGDNGHLLVMNQKALVSASESELLQQANVSKALFCGCAPFDSCDRYASVASKLLRDAQEIHIVHNRNAVYKLVSMFPNAQVIALPHDLGRHCIEFDVPHRDISAPLVERSQLRQLVGSTADQREECLQISRETTVALLRSCPDVCRIDSRWVVNCFTNPNNLLTPADRQRAKNFKQVIVVDKGLVSTTGLVLPLVAADVALAAKIFPSLETLQVFLGSQKELAKISAFGQLRSLAVAFGPSFINRDIGAQLEKVLKNFPGLQELDLEHCGGIRLLTVSKLCTRLRFLRVANCVGCMNDIPVDGNAFPDLERVELDMQIRKAVFDSLLFATRNKLRIVRFDDDGLCLAFLHYCVQKGRHQPFSSLERLTLNTKESLSALKLHPEDMHDVLSALPVVRHVETDSYDLRLFFENYCTPRGRVSLSWVGCVYCAAHSPDLFSVQGF